MKNNSFNNKSNKIFNYIIGVILILIVIVLILLFTSNSNNNYFNNINFKLLGASVEAIYQGDAYIDPMYTVYDEENKDLSDYVTIEGFVNTNQIGVYQLKYILKIDGKTKVLERVVNVIADPIKDFDINLSGGKDVYQLINQNYIDKGYYVTDNKGEKRSDIKVVVTDNIDVTKEGTYQVNYTISVMGSTKTVSRNVTVYEMQVSHSYSTTSVTSDNVTISLSIDTNLPVFKHVVMPDGKVSMDRKFSYQAEENGTYTFVIHDNYGNKFEKKVIVNNISRTYSCTGTVSRYGTSLQLNTNYTKNIKEYKWNLDGEVKTGSSKFTNSTKAYDKATLTLTFTNGETKTIGCTLNSTLVYKFKEGTEFYTCNAFTAADKVRMDAMLKEVINQAGYGTRAGVVEALRFLMGGTGYRLAYDGHNSTYNKVGLNIGNSQAWGCRVNGYRRGMDCTGIYWWPLYQNGIKDSLGNCSSKNVYLLKDVVDKVRVGDVLVTPDSSREDIGCYYAHATIIIGIDDNYIYAGSNGVIKIPKNNIPTKGSNSHVRLVEYPGGNGNITNMWVS